MYRPHQAEYIDSETYRIRHMNESTCRSHCVKLELRGHLPHLESSIPMLAQAS